MKSIKNRLLLVGLLIFSANIFAQDTKLSNETIWASGYFSAESVHSVRSMNDGEHFSVLENNAIVKYSYKKFGEPVATIIDLNEIHIEDEIIKANDYFFNSDESKVLIATAIKSIYRRSFTANYFIVDLKSKAVQELSKNGPQQLADFSPDGTKVAYVSDNNIYYLNLESSETIQVTNDGVKNAIINGGTDWVYEEEFAITKGFYWSPDNKSIAYYKFEEKDVVEFTMPYYLGKSYPFNYNFKYPKAGEDNSKLSIFIYDVRSNSSHIYAANNSIYEYYPRIKWTQNNALCVLGLNRHQNELSYFTMNNYHSTNPRTDVFYTDKSETYVEVDNNLIFLKDGKSLLRTSEKDGFRHIYKVGFDGQIQQITKGSWDVVDLKGIDEDSGRLYYTSGEEGAIYKALYSINIDGTDKLKLSTQKGSNDAEFSNGMKYYINYYSNANEPEVITLHTQKGKNLEVLKDNKALKLKLQKLDLPTREFIQIKGAEVDLNASIIKPKNFDASKKYPVYFYIYNGPGSNVVNDSWGGRNYLYHQLLANNGIIVISVDTRGTMNRGRDFKNSTYLQLGKLETEDMIAVAKNVGKWTYVDTNRIGVQGWSYGGYMSTLCMTKGADVFKMGIAVAPVTNWRWYDNIYTERFMRTPSENASGYDDNSPINHIEKLKGKFLIVHGSADDNVHLQNSMELINAMVNKNIEFDMAIYPNKNHGIYGGYTRLHLYNKLFKFTLNNL